MTVKLEKEQILHAMHHARLSGGHIEDIPDAVYVIECPSPEDALEGRSEGETLARTFKLAGIEVHYHLALNEEMVEAAFSRIARTVKSRSDWGIAMPWIHFSAHGGFDGLEMTDGTTLFWAILERYLYDLHNEIGAVLFPDHMNQDYPKSSLALSSCSAFEAFAEQTDSPFAQCVVGAVRDVGWCQSLIAFSTFYYHALHLRRGLESSVAAMNVASGDLEEFALFQYYRPHVGELLSTDEKTTES